MGKISHAMHQTCSLDESSSVMLLHGFLWVTVFPEKVGTAQITIEITDGKESFNRTCFMLWFLPLPTAVLELAWLSVVEIKH